MKVRVALEAPVVPPETGASTRVGWAALQPLQGCASLCRELAAAAACISRAVGGSMVEESISKAGRTPPVLPAAGCSQGGRGASWRHAQVSMNVPERRAAVHV